MKNLLVGAVSTNYTISDVKNWVSTSKWDNCDRILLLYESNGYSDTISKYLQDEGVQVIKPNFNFWGTEQYDFTTNTGHCDLQSSYELVHNLRFLHIWNILLSYTYNKVLITDVRDVIFNQDPFQKIPEDRVIVSSEEITYQDDSWNFEHLYTNLGIIGLSVLQEKNVYNVGVFGGSYDIVKSLCADIYLNSVGRNKVADQTSFNYLIQTKYKDVIMFTDIADKFAVHLHVVSTGLIDFDLTKLPEYSIVHQYDRIPELQRLYE